MATISGNLEKLVSDIDCRHKTGLLPVMNECSFHYHNGYELLIYLGGTTDLFIETQGTTLKRGDIVLLRPQEFHGIILKDPDTYDRVVINFTDEYIQSINSCETKLEKPFYDVEEGKMNIFHIPEEKLQNLLTMSHKLQKSLLVKEYGWELSCKAFLIEILLYVNKYRDKSKLIDYPYADIMPDIVRLTFAYIEDNLTEKMSLEILSQKVHHNGDYISRCFKQVTGMSVQQYILTKRLTLAQRLLADGQFPTDVCFEVGFNNYSNFSRTFSKYVGCSPKKYQESHKDDN